MALMSLRSLSRVKASIDLKPYMVLTRADHLFIHNSIYRSYINLYSI